MHKDNMTNEKNINLTDATVAADLLVEEQIAHSISGLLDRKAQQLKPEYEQRLAMARNAAVNHLTERQAEYNGVNSTGGHVLRSFGHNFEQHRLASTALLLAVILVTFFAVQHFGFNNNLENSDAFLLASDLPPEAYADKGFDAWIESN